MTDSRKYQVLLSPLAGKELKSLARNIRKRVEGAIESLASDPRPQGAKSLKSNRELWRIRVGKYRVVYKIDDNRLLVLVIKISKRSEVYRDL